MIEIQIKFDICPNGGAFPFWIDSHVQFDIDLDLTGTRFDEKMMFGKPLKITN